MHIWAIVGSGNLGGSTHSELGLSDEFPQVDSVDTEPHCRASVRANICIKLEMIHLSASAVEGKLRTKAVLLEAQPTET